MSEHVENGEFHGNPYCWWLIVYVLVWEN